MKLKLVSLLILYFVGSCNASEIGSLSVFPQQCGLQSLLVSMVLLQLDSKDIDRYKSESPSLIRNTSDLSLADLKSNAENYGLTADGFKFDSIDNMESAILKENSIYVVHLYNDSTKKGHFIVCSRNNTKQHSEKFLLIDYPTVFKTDNLTRALTESQNLEPFRFTGAVLRMGKNNISSQTPISIANTKPSNTEGTEINLKDENLVPVMYAKDCIVEDSGSENLTGNISIVNRTSFDLRVDSVVSSCGCFKGAVFTPQIAIDATRNITLTFNGESIRSLKSSNLVIKLISANQSIYLIRVFAKVNSNKTFSVERTFRSDSKSMDLALRPAPDCSITSLSLLEVDDGVKAMEIPGFAFRLTSEDGSFFKKKIKLLINKSQEFDVELSGMGRN